MIILFKTAGQLEDCLFRASFVGTYMNEHIVTVETSRKRLSPISFSVAINQLQSSNHFRQSG